TISDITDEVIAFEELDSYQHDVGNIKSIYPLSPMQEGLLFHSLSESGEAYHVSMMITITGELDIECLNRSFQELVNRHDSLRTGFDSLHFKDHMQLVYKSRDPELHYRDISKIKGNKHQYVQQLMREDRARGFDLSKDSLIRLYIIKLDESEFNLILSN